MVDRYLLRYFLAVLDQGNFTRAAAQAGVSQPTLSVGIAKLERMLDRMLFDRSNRRVALTAAGTAFAVHARRIEAEFAAAERAVQGDRPDAPLRIGVASTLPAGWIEHALHAVVRARSPERVEVIEGRMRDLHPRLERGRIDVLLGPVDDVPRARDILFDEGYALVLPAGHPLAGRGTIAAPDVANAAMIVRRHCEALPEISRFFTRRGVRPFIAARTTDDARALGYVRAGLGLTVMPRCLAGPGVAMAALDGFDRRRRIGFLARDGGDARLDASAAYRTLVDSLRATAPSGG